MKDQPVYQNDGDICSGNSWWSCVLVAELNTTVSVQEGYLRHGGKNESYIDIIGG